MLENRFEMDKFVFPLDRKYIPETTQRILCIEYYSVKLNMFRIQSVYVREVLRLQLW